MNLAYALFITGTAIAAKALLPYQWSDDLLIYILLMIVAINRFEIRKILEPTKPNTKNENKALNICDVRLSCFQEVWQKWCDTKSDEEFDKWLHDKMHEA